MATKQEKTAPHTLNGRNGHHNGTHNEPTITPFQNPFASIAEETPTLIINDGDTPAQREDGRFWRILLFFGWIIFVIVVLDIGLGRVPLLGGRIRAGRPRRIRLWSRRFRKLSLEMGGVMIKLGQFLSARVDVLPPEVTEELLGLQDEVPAENPWRMFAVLEDEIGAMGDHFAKVEERPLAAASLGQTHRAWLFPNNGQNELGDAVVIKIQRPNIDKIVQTDLSALRIVARWVMRYQPIRKRANVPALMEEFGETLWEELDYRAEVKNLHRLATIHESDPHIYIPAVYESLCSEKVIVMENVESFKINEVDAIRAAGIDPKEVADVLLSTYFKQVFKEGFFHADPHPGNLFIKPRTDIPWEPRYDGAGNLKLDRQFWLIFVDFGMVGRIAPAQKEQLRKIVVSIAQQDARSLTEAYDQLGFFLPDADLERIIEAQTEILGRIYGRNLLDLARPDPAEIKEIGEQFYDLLFDFPLQIPQDFIYLGRAVGIVSGLVTLLDEEVNPWYFIERFGQDLLAEEVARQVDQFDLNRAVELVKPYLDTPRRLQRIIVDAENGRLRVQSAPDRATVIRQERLEKRIGQLSWSILGAAGMISATLLFLNRKKEDSEK